MQQGSGIRDPPRVTQGAAGASGRQAYSHGIGMIAVGYLVWVTVPTAGVPANPRVEGGCTGACAAGSGVSGRDQLYAVSAERTAGCAP